jgi:catechol-2,3-dioxygenase
VAIARLGAIALDTNDANMLSRFYRDLLDASVLSESADEVMLAAGGLVIIIDRIENHRPPDWPDCTVPKQFHLEILVDDLDSGERAVLALGARKAGAQPQPDRWRVMLDPSGHPFCLTVQLNPAESTSPCP